MKRLLFFLMAMIFAISGWSQTTLNEGFEGTTFPPDDWAKVTTQGTEAWERYTSDSPRGLACASVNYDDPSHINYLITPKLIVSSDQDSIVYWVKTDYNFGGTTLNVLVSTTDNAVASFSTTSLQTVSTLSESWVRKSIPLTNYIGEEIYIAFQVVDFYGSRVMLDDVTGPELFVPSCPKPTALSATNPTTTGVDLGWTDVTGTIWNIQYMLATETDWTNSTTISGVTNPYTLATLNSSSAYKARVQTDCGTEQSEWSSVITFATGCDVITTIPWTEGFETDWLSATSPGNRPSPNCWTVVDRGNTDDEYWWRHSSDPDVWEGNSNHSGTGHALCYTDYGTSAHNDWLISPLISLTGNERLRFWAMRASDGTTEPDEISVFISDDTFTTLDTTGMGVSGNMPGFTQIFTQMLPVGSWQQYEINLSQYSGNRYIAFVRQNTPDGWYLRLDDIEISELPTCMRPTNVVVSNVTTTDAEISWVNGSLSDASWWLYYKQSSATTYDSVLVNSNPYTLTTLLPSSGYNIYVVTDCGTELSQPSIISNFRTACESITTLPFLENFDTYGTAAGTFPACWYRPVINSTYPSVVTAYYVSSPVSLRFQSASATAPTYAITPPIGVDINTLKVKFMLKAESTTSSGTMEVGVMSDPAVLSSFELVTTIQPTSTNFTEYEVLFNNTTLTGAGNHIAFKHVTVSSIYYYWLDDVVVDIIPSCPHPDSLYAANVTQTDADIYFTPSDLADAQWKLYYRQAGTSSWTDVDIFAIPHQLTSLTANTAYEVYVTTLCGDATYSDASTILTFRTPCDNVLTIPYTENFDNYGTGTAATSYPTCWSRNVTTYATANYPYISTTNFSTPGAMYFYAYNNTRTVAVCHPIDATIPINTLMIEFKMRYSVLDNNGIQVGVMTDPNDFTTFVPIGTPQTISAINVWEDKAVLLTDYVGTGQYIALAAIAPASEYARSYVDNFVVDYTPVCPNVYGLAVGVASTTSVNVNWDNSGDLGDGFNIAYASNLTGTFDPTTATIIPITTGTTLPYVIPGFNPGDSVWAAVQRGCNGTWTAAQKVTLPLSAITLPYSQNFEDTLLVSEWMFTSSNSTTTDMWDIGSATGNPGNSMYVSSNGGVTNSYTQVSTYNYATALVEFGQAAEFGLTFDWKGMGESCCDKFSVYLLPMSAPMPTTGYPVGGTTLLAPINQQSTWQTKNIILPSATFANSIQRLVFVWYSDVTSITDPPAAVDNITITSTDCGTPTTLAASNILTTSADVTWTEVGTATSWYLYYKPASSTTYDSILVSTTPTYSFTNLIANTAYNIYVVADCGTQFSNYSNVVNFRTACDAISTLPYSENFEGYGTGTSIMPACWVRTTTYADRPYVNSGGYSGNCLYFYAGTAGTYNIAAMNPIDASIPINTLMATFYYKNYASTDRLIVGVMTDPTNASTFDSITTIAAPSTATWAEYEVNFSAYTGLGTYIAFKNIYTTTYGYAYLDNLVVDIIPSCARPTALSATGTGTSMDVSFTPGNLTDNAWYIYYKPASATDWDSVYTAIIPTNIPGLTLQTTYQIYAKTVCSDGSNSNASQTITYTTPCSSGAISSFPWTEGFEGGLMCWTISSSVTSANWTSIPSGTWPTATPHSGSNMIMFNSNSISSGGWSTLYSPLLDFPNDQYQISFWLFRDNADYLTNADRVELYVNSTASETGAALLGTVNRSYSLAPIETSGGWYQYTFNLPAGMTGNNYVILKGISAYGRNVYVDDLMVDGLGTPCPQPTNVVVTPSNISATVTWSIGAESAWEVRLGEIGTPTAVSNAYYTIPSLSPGTPYTVYVRSNCGTGYSAWVSVQFTTTTAPTPPSVSTTVPTTQITQTTAVFNGAYLQGSDTIQSKGFEYKKTTDASWTDQVVIDGTTPFTYTATNLSASTEYKVKSYVTTATDGRVFGDTITFTTLAIIPPTVTTDSVRNVSQTSATFYGTITANTEQIEARGFEYKLSTEAWADAIIISATGVTNIYASPTTLQDGRTYNVRAYGRTLSDTSYGQTLTFSTLTAPTVTTTPTQPADVQSTSATLKGTVTSAGNALPSQVVVGFVYSTTTNPVIGATGVLQAEATYSTTDPNFTTQITELASNTNYFFKAYITNPVTTAYGNEANFITLGLLGVDGKEISIMMYPNPATSQTNLIVEGVSGETKIVLSDVQGRILNTINTKAVNGVVEQTIDLNNLAKGVYYIRIQNSYINRTQKLIVK